MNNTGPVIIIEDDIDDQEILQQVFVNLKYPNELIFFPEGQAALDYLDATDTVPFLILSDINLPKLDGFALRSKIRLDAKLDIKCIPYLFFTTASNRKSVVEAYSVSAQGFFVKPSNFTEIEHTIRLIMEYWKACIAPNNFEQLN
ncbi:MAG: response regulator [Chitinophagaceae bacterium]